MDPRIPLGVEPIAFVPEQQQRAAAPVSAAVLKQQREAAELDDVAKIWQAHAYDPPDALKQIERRRGRHVGDRFRDHDDGNPVGR